MNWPNGLTVARLVLGPIVLVTLLSAGVRLSFFLFVIAMVTDLCDGYLARRSNRVTEFGKLMDPLADKVLVGLVLVGFVILDVPYVPLWMVATVLGRELLILGCRTGVLKSGEGFVTSRIAKLKTAAQMTWIALILFYLSFLAPGGAVPGALAADPATDVLWGLGVVVVALTVVSGVEYLLNGRGIARAHGTSPASPDGRGGMS
jgi:CDP-diacylglycerol--glycerol-3-phosphate 3-phosphatidyltransferase